MKIRNRMPPKFFLLIIALCLISALVLYKYRDYVSSVVFNSMGKDETVESIIKKLESPVRSRLADKLREAGFEGYPSRLLLYAIKEDQRLEVYGQQGQRGQRWALIKAYPFTAFSGTLGPKLKEGDRQIPEGLYRLEYLNPNSKFHLSIKINYPNTFDKKMGHADGRSNLGNDIFIHGKAMTIGCIPIGDKGIEELFLLVTKAGKEHVEVIIAPSDFRKTTATRPKLPHLSWTIELYDLIETEIRAQGL